uniref:Uncharacterized protein n=1 Tax=Quercus lobata TaxID=97700 RepID=A0A7N2MV99_QUELO
MTEGCRECYIKGGQCKIDHKGKAYCTKGTKGNNRSRVVALASFSQPLRLSSSKINQSLNFEHTHLQFWLNDEKKQSMIEDIYNTKKQKRRRNN